MGVHFELISGNDEEILIDNSTGIISYTPKAGVSIENIFPCIIKSNKRILNGTIECKFELESVDSLLSFQFLTDSQIPLVCGYSMELKKFVIRMVRGKNSVDDLCNPEGHIRDNQRNIPLNLRINITGSEIEIFFNDVSICKNQKPIQILDSPIEIYLKSTGKLKLGICVAKTQIYTMMIIVVKNLRIFWLNYLWKKELG